MASNAAALASGRPAARGPLRAPAQLYCAVAGAALLIAGIAGFFVNSSFGDASNRGTLIIFDVNGWHNVVHILSGLVLLAAAPRATPARMVAGAFGAVYGIVAIWGFISGDSVLWIIPVNTADNVLHIALAALGLLAAAAPAVRVGGAEDPEAAFARLERYGLAADASSPNQVFVGMRG